jgi:hypothetical protein
VSKFPRPLYSRLVQQREQAEELLRKAYPKYHTLIASQPDKVKIAIGDLLKCVKDRKISLMESIYDGHVPNEPKYRDVLGNLLALAEAIDPLSFNGEEMLRELGFVQKEIDDLLYGMATLARIDPDVFLKLVSDALNYAAIAPWCTEATAEFVGRVLGIFS